MQQITIDKLKAIGNKNHNTSGDKDNVVQLGSKNSLELQMPLAIHSGR
jgi:hypothetical protein